MIKKLILAGIISVASPLAAQAANTSWPIAVVAPLLIPLVAGTSPLAEAITDGLNFDHAREIAFSITLPGTAAKTNNNEESNPPLQLSYALRWGYKGAGNRNEPFAGMQGSINVQLSYDGLTFQLGKSRSLRPFIKKFISPAVTVTPCQEFYFKLAQLAWTVSQQRYPDLVAVRESLQILIERLKKTEGGAACTIRSLPVLTTPEKPGLEGYLTQSPDHCAAQFIVLSQKAGALIGLLTSSLQSAERAAYLNALMEQVNYYQEEPTLITLPNGGSLYIPFWEVGSGSVDEPFKGITLTLNVPASPGIPQATEWHLPLTAEQTGFVRALMLIIHNRRSPLGAQKYLEELSTLCTRMCITPPSDGTEPGMLRAILGQVCFYHQDIAHYSFDEPLDTTLDNKEFLLQLCRILYHAYIRKEESPQAVADFITIHLADAIRCYEGTIKLKEVLSGKARLPILEKHGITINWGLFAKTILSPAPGTEEA